MIGGFLARGGHDVSLLGRKWHLGTIQKEGLKITGLWGEHRVRKFQLFEDVATLKKHAKKNPFDLIILTVKSYHTYEALNEIKSFMNEKSMFLSFQNGLGNVETILETIPKKQCLTGRIITGVDLEPGHVDITVSADSLVIGNAHEEKTLLSPIQVATELHLCLIPARAVTNIMTHIWSKVIYNCALNAPCSVHDIPYGELMKNEDRKESVRRIVEECYAVAKKKGMDLIPETPKEYIELLVDELIPSTASHYPSMLADLKRRGRTEIDALNGAMSRLGKELNIKTPENDTMTKLIKQKETWTSEKPSTT